MKLNKYVNKLASHVIVWSLNQKLNPSRTASTDGEQPFGCGFYAD